jgi:hypothetical protein
MTSNALVSSAVYWTASQPSSTAKAATANIDRIPTVTCVLCFGRLSTENLRSCEGTV